MRMTGNVQNARDVLQEAFILAFKHLRQVKHPEQFAGWLRRIVINECIRFSKRSVQWRSLEDSDYEPVPDEGPAWWTAIGPELVHEAIKELPEGCRQVFVLYVLEDFSHKDIAKSLRISESTSKSQYQRARKLLKDRLLKKVIDG
jgi:RNA polymerase sigma-70 factor (ECF subfamily)